jgi:hypothetical protein
VNTTERRQWEALQADRTTIERAASWLRQNAWQESYAGFREKDRAFAAAHLMEALSVQLDRVPPGLRAEAARGRMARRRLRERAVLSNDDSLALCYRTGAGVCSE